MAHVRRRWSRGPLSSSEAQASAVIAVLGHMSAGQVLRLRRLETRAALKAVGQVIYAVRTMDDLIKIGHTTNLEQRLTTYGIGGDLRRLLFAIPGSLVDEQILHGRFAPHVARGREYYHPVPELIAYVNEVRDQLGVDPIR